MGFVRDFKSFLREYKIVGLTVAFVMGTAATNFVNATVNTIFMPFITPFVPGGAWRDATLAIGPIVVGWGAFLGALLNFLLISSLLYIVITKAMRWRRVAA